MDRLIADGTTVDAIITDPPYGMSYQSNARADKHSKIKNDDCLDWLEGFVNRSYNLSKDNTAHYIFCSFHNIDIFKQAFEKKFTIKNILVWEKTNNSMGDLKGNYATRTEFILFLHKGRRLMNGKRTPNIFKFARTRNELHPTQKPVELMSHLIEKFTDKDQTVLDPFMGSGTTGVACKQTGREFIGIELDKDYFEIASNRIQEVLI